MSPYFYGCFDILSMYPYGNPHEHVLGSLGNLPINFEQVRSLQCLETKVLVAEVTVIDYGRVEALGEARE